jgi:putative ABC transport system permease protein
MAALRWSSAWKISTREMHAARAKFVFVLLSVAIGVAALTGVRSFSASFRRSLLTEARTIMAADLSARMAAAPGTSEQRQLDAMAQGGMQMTQVTEMISMASPANSNNPVLVSLKAVDPTRYPFYGTVKLEPAGALSQVLTDDSVVVAPELLIRTQTNVGDSLRLNGKAFRIAATIRDEPDRLSNSMGIGLRVMMTQQGMESTGLFTPNGTYTRRYLFKLPVRSDSAVAAAKKELEAALPEAMILDYREASPALTQGLDHATDLLSLMSLVAMVLGAIGVGMSMRAHLQQRMDSIAIMKSLGASSGQIIKIYLLQTLLLGTVGALLGVLLGLGVQFALPLILEKLIHVEMSFHLEFAAIAIGFATGLLTTLLFTLPPLLDIRSVRPASIFRRAVEEAGSKDWKKRIKQNWLQIVAGMILFAGLAGIAVVLSDSARVGWWFAGGLAVTVGTAVGMAALLLKVLRALLRVSRLRLPQVVRQGFANLYRPGNQTAAVLAALGTGVMLVASVFFFEHAIVTDLRLTSANNLPNIFLMGITPDQVDGMRALLKTQPGVRGTPEMIPAIAAHIVSINGVPAKEVKLKNYPRRMMQRVQLSWSDPLPPGTKVLKGSWWTAGTKAAQLAIGPKEAERLGVQLGSHIMFGVEDQQIDAMVSAIIQSDGQHGASRMEFLLPQAAVSSLPAMWFGGVHVDPPQVSTVQRALYAAYPNVTIIDVADAMETIRSLVLQITHIVQFLAAFSIFAGVVVLASSVAGTRYRRLREIVVLKTLGATRARIATIFSVEFAVLGLLAGSIGVIFATLLTRVLLPKMNIDFHVQWGAAMLTVVLAMVVTNGAGWAASFRLLGQKPLAVLREE